MLSNEKRNKLDYPKGMTKTLVGLSALAVIAMGCLGVGIGVAIKYLTGA